jgi:predicted transcriptional regulator
MIKRIHWDVVLLIIKYVLENPKILRTPLAQKCNRNYLQLIKYLDMMELVEIIIVPKVERNQKTYIYITELGKRILDKSKD